MATYRQEAISIDQKQEVKEMNSWVLSTFLVLTCYMLIHASAAYLRRELRRKVNNSSMRR